MQSGHIIGLAFQESYAQIDLWGARARILELTALIYGLGLRDYLEIKAVSVTLCRPKHFTSRYTQLHITYAIPYQSTEPKTPYLTKSLSWMQCGLRQFG